MRPINEQIHMFNQIYFLRMLLSRYVSTVSAKLTYFVLIMALLLLVMISGVSPEFGPCRAAATAGP